jgi:hypothetical protein
MAEDTIAHFSHPGHELVKRHYVGPFLCDLCWEDLSGPAYGCRAGCNFAIHVSCAGHPRTLLSPAHHPHQLELSQTARGATFACDVCAGRCAPGCFLYRCPPCGFDMHPRCVQLPPAVRSSRHPEHDLTLVVAEGRCAASACRHSAGQRTWFYRCSACSLDLHASCAAAAGRVHRHDVHGELVRARISAESQMRMATALAATAASVRSAASSLFYL